MKKNQPCRFFEICQGQVAPVGGYFGYKDKETQQCFRLCPAHLKTIRKRLMDKAYVEAHPEVFRDY